MKTLTTIVLAGVLAAAACGRDDGGGLLARAGDHELTVNEASRLLSGVSDLPNEPPVVQALADLWIDYTLLAEAVARDSLLTHLDVDPLLDQSFEQDMVFALRDSVVQPDTSVNEEELRELYERDTPGSRVHARHIIMTYPQGGTQEQKDSVRAVMEGLLRRVRAGADFAALAREHSQDPGSGSQGGDLGWFERGDMVRPFEEAAFSLAPGETSPVVETPFGYHIIRVEERETPSFDDVRSDFTSRVQEERFQRAESTYIASVEEAADIRTVEGAADLVRELARAPDQTLSRRAGARALVEYRGGTFTLAEAQTFLRTRQPQFRQGLVSAPDDAIEDSFLRGLVQRELLVARAREAGLGPSSAERDSVAGLYRERFRAIARELGLHPLEPMGSETRAQAVERTVEEKLRSILAGTDEVLPLNAVSFVLRAEYDARTFAPSGIEATVARVASLRGPSGTDSAAPPPSTSDSAAPDPAPLLPTDTPADTSGNGG